MPEPAFQPHTSNAAYTLLGFILNSRNLFIYFFFFYIDSKEGWITCIRFNFRVKRIMYLKILPGGFHKCKTQDKIIIIIIIE